MGGAKNGFEGIFRHFRGSKTVLRVYSGTLGVQKCKEKKIDFFKNVLEENFTLSLFRISNFEFLR